MRLKALISGLIVASVSFAFADPKSGEEYPAQSLNWDLPLEAIGIAVTFAPGRPRLLARAKKI